VRMRKVFGCAREGKSMGESYRITNLNISKKSCPELYEELKALTNRVRTERLRTLATIGLYALNAQTAMGRGNTDDSGVAPKTQPESTKTAAPPQTAVLEQNKQLLKNRLLDSM